MKEKLLKMGFKHWKKSEQLERVYIDVLNTKYGISNVTDFPQVYRKLNLYYNCVSEKFGYNFLGNSFESTISDYIEYLINIEI